MFAVVFYRTEAARRFAIFQDNSLMLRKHFVCLSTDTRNNMTKRSLDDDVVTLTAEHTRCSKYTKQNPFRVPFFLERDTVPPCEALVLPSQVRVGDFFFVEKGKCAAVLLSLDPEQDNVTLGWCKVRTVTGHEEYGVQGGVSTTHLQYRCTYDRVNHIERQTLERLLCMFYNLPFDTPIPSLRTIVERSGRVVSWVLASDTPAVTGV